MTGTLSEDLVVVTGLLYGTTTEDNVLSIVGKTIRRVAFGFLIAICVENCCVGYVLHKT